MSVENQFLDIAESLIKVEYVRKEGIEEVRRTGTATCNLVTLKSGYAWTDLPVGPKGAGWKTLRNTLSVGERWSTDVRVEFLQVSSGLLDLSMALAHGKYALKVLDAYGRTYIIGDQDNGGRFFETGHDGGGFDNVVNESVFNFKITSRQPPLLLAQ
jgi:hypothetical protein